jgi:predicted nucleic acid-binding protein
MSDKTFVDSNVLIYAHDLDAKEKYGTANDHARNSGGNAMAS